MCYQDICSQFLPCMEVWGIPMGGQETMLAANKLNLSKPVCVGTLGIYSVPLWHPTIASVGWADQSEGRETQSWYLGHPPCLTLFHIYTHLGHTGESQDTVRSTPHFLTVLQTQYDVFMYTQGVSPSWRKASSRACAPSSLKSQDLRILAAQSIWTPKRTQENIEDFVI